MKMTKITEPETVTTCSCGDCGGCTITPNEFPLEVAPGYSLPNKSPLYTPYVPSIPFTPCVSPEGTQAAADKEDITNPNHYRLFGIQPIDYMLDKFGPEGLKYFCLGNTIKYISRAGKKAKETELDDLKKAKWYLDKAIAVLEDKND